MHGFFVCCKEFGFCSGQRYCGSFFTSFSVKKADETEVLKLRAVSVAAVVLLLDCFYFCELFLPKPCQVSQTVLILEGSGKSSVAQALAKRLGWPMFDADDFHPPKNIEKMKRGEPLNDEDRAPWLTSLAEAISKHCEPEATGKFREPLSCFFQPILGFLRGFISTTRKSLASC